MCMCDLASRHHVMLEYKVVVWCALIQSMPHVGWALPPLDYLTG